MHKKIFLVGMPGSGKTTLGKPIAAKLGLPFFDLDQIIEDKEQMEIKEIFSQKGEAYFREAEANLLRDFSLKNETFLLSTGGGTACFHKGMQFMNETGLTIFINVPYEELFRRLHGNGTDDRPLLKGKSQEELERELEGKVMERLPYYNKAQISIKGGNLSPEEILNLL
ncbi:shikimate kinase [Persicobacter sp. CCB-QB2]|uniref:shikimate kinase n=1 Tax=Persicobacter sp. CCB-QB2 TaxID=1561025 RepID=UPI0006A9C604|nr:shikimate kinase [Persicobacter sp. CCB-QB2]